MTKTSIERLNEFGQSIWLDNISRSMIQSGKLKDMINSGLKGLTSNPTIFDKAIRSSDDYDKEVQRFSRSGKSTFQIYDDLTVKDIQDAADIFKPVYDMTNRLDGYVSLEVNPKLSYKPKETVEEARRLFRKVNRPNIMLKVPATDAGFAAIEELLAEGININVTLIFSLEQYIKTAYAFLNGIDRLLEYGKDPRRVHSVASVFVSRIDTLIDNVIDKRIAVAKDENEKDKLESLKGKTAAANSSLIFEKYLEIFSGAKFKRLKEYGANLQRVLWGSTGTKNPAYSDIKYVTELIGKNTINTLPENTIKAFLDHGIVKETLTSDVRSAQDVIDGLNSFGIRIDSVCRKLLENGVIAFEKSFDSLIASIETKEKVFM
ncbi:transaldolase [Candidatus Omnitrophota bacterium]